MSAAYLFHIVLADPSTGSVSTFDRVDNTLYELQSVRDKSTGLHSNTNSRISPATWHLSIEQNSVIESLNGRPLDPWDLWIQSSFDIAKVEVITGPKAAKPWLLNYRRRDDNVIREEEAAEISYQARVDLAKRTIQDSLSPPIPASPGHTLAAARRGSSVSETTEKDSFLGSTSPNSTHSTFGAEKSGRRSLWKEIWKRI